ncbi:MAG: hypothetical protein A4E32_00598 [Methanomassiliicoccales archaeon PtaU1.Bin124]|nr:MAG: hypothetical protein A4E32_00598 [Methanomassiliicoccales archaeon PtaU1.Bin124]
MLDASAPGSLLNIAYEIKARGGTGILISGGCDEKGRLPLTERMDEIRAAGETGLRLNIHTGLVDMETASSLARTGAERFSMDMHQSEGVIRDILHLRTGPERYVDTLRSLCSAAPGKVTPHICAGLEGDRIDNEKKSVDAIAGYEISNLVILSHVPISAAPLNPIPALTEDKLLALIHYALDTIDRPILLGCMRPRKTNRVELEAARAGVAGIANPKVETLRALQKEGFIIQHQRSCCALHL